MNIDINGVKITLTKEQLKQIEDQQKKNRPIIERIDTLDDVYKDLGINRNSIIPFKNPINKQQRSANAFIDIQNISKCLNEDDSFPNFNNNEYKYCPYFKKVAPGGWVYDCYDYWGSNGHLGFGCYYKTSDLSIFAGNTFISVYNDYLPE